MAQPYWENFELITTRQGLPNNIVLSLLQDSEGYLWVGTYNGLCRYNGHSFEVYKDIFGPAQSNNWFHAIETIYEDRQGIIWIGSRGGLISSFDKRRQRFQPYKHAQGGNKIAAFYEDAANRVWVAHQNGMCGIVAGDSIRYVQPVKENIVGIAGGGKAPAILITDKRLIYYDSISGWSNYPITAPGGNAELFTTKGIDIYTASHNKNGALLFTSVGCMILDIGARKLKKILEPLPPGRTIYIKSTGTAEGYIIASAFMLFMYDSMGQCTNSFHISITAWNDNHEIHNCLVKDNTGIIWLGTNSGLYKIDPRRYYFKKYARNNEAYPLADNYVRSLLSTGKELWVGTKDGRINLLEYEGGIKGYVLKKSYPIHAPQHSCTINTLLKYGNEMMAAGDEGLLRMKNKEADYFEMDPKIKLPGAIHGIWAMYTDSTGNIWVGTNMDGLYIWEASTGNTYRYGSTGGTKLAATSIWNVYKDRKGVVWLGTDSGLYYIQDSRNVRALKIVQYPIQSKDKLPVIAWSLTEDKYGNLWMGSTGHGLYQVTADRKRYMSYGQRPNNVISAVVADSIGNLWISTVDGLYRYDIDHMHFTAYDEQDGLLSNEFNFKAGTATPYGLLFFGNKTGLLALNPQQVSLNIPAGIPPRISSLHIAGRDSSGAIYAKGPVMLRHDENFIDIGFSITDFSKPLTSRYRYCLQGFDNLWHEAPAGQPTATYTNLPPGNYRFVVYGSTNGNNWANTPAVLNFIIKPAFWQTLLFRTGLVLLVVLLCGWLVYRRIQTIVLREQEKHRIEKQIASLELQALQAQMNPHFIFNAINSIQHFIIHNDEVTANDYLTRFARLMRLFLESSKNRYIPLASELELLHLYLQLEQLRFEDRFHYEINVDPGLDIQNVKIPPALLQPFVENAIIHGLVHLDGEGALHLSFLSGGNNKIICVIDDNGIGRKAAATINKAHKGTHVSRGVQLIEERIKTYNFIDEQDIQIHITDKIPPLQGTRIEITIPIKPLQ